MTRGYPGSKGASGVAEKIISEMPRHRVYLEPFVGHSAVLRKKRAAEWFIAVDADADVAAWWSDRIAKADGGAGRPEMAMEALIDAADGAVRWRRGAIVVAGDGIAMLKRIAGYADATWLVYCDPPYLRSTRTRSIYKHELESEEEHARLLEALLGLKCHVMISGYRSSLYMRMLKEWRAVSYTTSTRGGARTEFLWCNFPSGLPLHDTRWVGRDFHDRERIRRKRARWLARLRAMPPHERQMIFEALAELSCSSGANGDAAGDTGSRHN